MIKKTAVCLALILSVTVSFYGCKTSGLSLKKPGMASEIIADSLSNMPEDAARVVRAAAGLLAGKPLSSSVSFPGEISGKILDAGIVEAGFTLTGCKLYQYDTPKNSSDRRIMAVLDFENPLGRHCRGELKADYQVEAGAIHVESASCDPVFETIPKTLCFVLPANEVPCTRETLPTSFEALYQTVAQKAVVPTDSTLSNREQDWGMVVFFMDRISPSARVRLGVSASDKGFDGYTDASQYVDYNGWRVGFAAGRFAMKDPVAENKLYLKAVYTPGKEAGFFKASTITGLFSLKQ